MNSLIQLINECGILILALVVGLRAFTLMNTFINIIFLQLIVWIIFFTLSYVITIWQHSNGLSKNNHYLLNIHLFLETSLLIIAASAAFKTKAQKMLAPACLIVFAAVYFYNLFLYGINTYSHHSDLAACFLISFLYVIILYNCFTKTIAAPWKLPQIYICTGILAYFASSIPYIAMMGHLQLYHPKVNEFLFALINDILANLRYLLLAIAFWLLYRTHLNLKPNE